MDIPGKVHAVLFDKLTAEKIPLSVQLLKYISELARFFLLRP